MNNKTKFCLLFIPSPIELYFPQRKYFVLAIFENHLQKERRFKKNKTPSNASILDSWTSASWGPLVIHLGSWEGVSGKLFWIRQRKNPEYTAFIWECIIFCFDFSSICWNRFPGDHVDSLSLKVFNIQLDKPLKGVSKAKEWLVLSFTVMYSRMSFAGDDSLGS